VTSPIREENNEGGSDLYPHIYGPLDLDAVIDTRPLAVTADGTLVLDL
jgi:uncharacterized protein (DUF952 family)